MIQQVVLYSWSDLLIIPYYMYIIIYKVINISCVFSLIQLMSIKYLQIYLTINNPNSLKLTYPYTTVATFYVQYKVERFFFYLIFHLNN